MAAKKTTKTTKKKATKKVGSGALDMARKAVSKAIGNKEESVVQLDPNRLKESHPHIPSGSIILDYLFGGRPNRYGVRPCPGVPRGKITNVYGNPGAGKTTMALTVAASVCDDGGTVAYIDWENEVDPTYAATLGVPISDKERFLLIQPVSLEEGFAWMTSCASAGVDLIVIDSVGAAVPEEIMSKIGKGDMGRIGILAAKWGKFLPYLKTIIGRSGTAVIGISQLRTKISTGPASYGGPTTQAQGGWAWKFYSNIRLRLTVIQKEKEQLFNHVTGQSEVMVTGTKVKAKLDKCKVSEGAFHEQVLYLKSGEGYDDVRSIIEIAISYNIIKKGGSWFTYVRPDGTEIKGQGMPGFRTKLMGAEGAIMEVFNAIEPHLTKDSRKKAELNAEAEGTEDDVDLSAAIANIPT